MVSGKALILSIRTPVATWRGVGEGIHRNKPDSSFGMINGNWDTISCRTRGSLLSRTSNKTETERGLIPIY